MKRLTINNKFIAWIPSSWKDLTATQVEAICKLSLTSLNELSMRVQLFLIVTGLQLMRQAPIQVGPPSDHRYLFKMRSAKTGAVLIDSNDIQFVIREFSFLFTYVKNQPVIESRVVENHFPWFRNAWGRKLYGPASALFNITLDEFIRAETLYAQFSKTPDPVLINKFCAALYRPRNKKQDPKSPAFSGDVRQEYNDHLLEVNARYTKHLSAWQKIYIRMFYDGCRAFIIHKHPEAFSGGGEDPNRAKTVFEGFVSLVTALCDNDATRAAKLRKTLLWDVLPQLESLSVQMKSLRQQQEKRKR